MLRLNVGCGIIKMPGYVNVDKYCDADLQAAADSLPYGDGTVDEVFSSHLIEHLTPGELDASLNEWNRVLKVGGKLLIRCPNFDLYVREYLEASDDERAKKPMLLHCIFGLRNRPGQFHYDGFSVQRLRRLVSEYGFEVVTCEIITTRHEKGEEYRPDGDLWCEGEKL